MNSLIQLRTHLALIGALTAESFNHSLGNLLATHHPPLDISTYTWTHPLIRPPYIPALTYLVTRHIISLFAHLHTPSHFLIFLHFFIY